MWTEEKCIWFYFATTHRRATTLIQPTVQKIGSNSRLSEVTNILDARHGLGEAYIDIEDEIDEFINFDTECPRFYTKLISLARTTGDSVDEALSMSMEYLSNVSDVNDIFQDSLMTSLEFSSQIANLTDRMKDLSQHEVRDLLNMKRHLTKTLTHMEGHWDNLL